ncbi:MAG: ferritin-like domain-containing protein [Candidatus Binatia bacterium]|nr:ferritin-like domain-containing protein [Candidatus Binatia bacterium]
MSDFRVTTETQEPPFKTETEVIYQWNYDPEVEELRRLYVKAAEAQWVSERDLDWDRDIDMGLFESTPLGLGLPVQETSYWKGLPDEKRREITKKTAAFRLSNFLHGEQGALMVASQLVNAVPHTDAKFYAATQTMDEARHVEVFAKYIEKLDEIQPIAGSLKKVLDDTLSTGDWLKKLVGMQIVVEGLALFSFREMRNLTKEPLLKDLLTYVARDEARHHAYGVQYVERCVPQLSASRLEELEDFALDAASTLIDARKSSTLFASVLEIWTNAGLDAAALLESAGKEIPGILAKQNKKRRLGPVQGFVIPTLRRCGLLSDRVAGHYHEMLAANLSPSVVGEDLEDFLSRIPDLPEDTAAWVLSELQEDERELPSAASSQPTA